MNVLLSQSEAIHTRTIADTRSYSVLYMYDTYAATKATS